MRRKSTIAGRSEHESASTSARAAFRISSDSRRRTLGLASITIATLNSETSNFSGCGTPSSKPGNPQSAIRAPPRRPPRLAARHRNNLRDHRNGRAISWRSVPHIRHNSFRAPPAPNRLQLAGYRITLQETYRPARVGRGSFVFLLSLGKSLERRLEKSSAPRPTQDHTPQSNGRADARGLCGQSGHVPSRG